jgi:hypothetical protein
MFLLWSGTLMESLSTLTTIYNAIKNAFSWVLTLFGRKIAKIDEYKDEVVKVKMDYVDSSPQCIQERNNGATFYWSEYHRLGYKKYFEIDGNIRRFFWNDSKQYLMIKKQDK